MHHCAAMRRCVHALHSCDARAPFAPRMSCVSVLSSRSPGNHRVSAHRDVRTKRPTTLGVRTLRSEMIPDRSVHPGLKPGAATLGLRPSKSARRRTVSRLPSLGGMGTIVALATRERWRAARSEHRDTNARMTDLRPGRSGNALTRHRASTEPTPPTMPSPSPPPVGGL